MNTKKKTPIPIKTTIAVTAISSTIDTADNAASTVPIEPINKHFAYLQKQLSVIDKTSLLELIKPAIITYTSTVVPSANATQIPVKIRGVYPSAKNIAIMTPNIIPKMVPETPHPPPHGQHSLFFFIFINSCLNILEHSRTIHSIYERL